MLRSFLSQLATPGQPGSHGVGGSSGEAKTSISPTLRSDIYEAIDSTKAWISGAQGRGQAGDGVSYKPILALIQKHFPDANLGLESVGQVEGEVAVIVGGVTNMALEISRWEGMAGAMVMTTWVDALVEGHKKVDAESRKGLIAKGITRGLNHNADIALMTKEFTPKIQIISTLKSGELPHLSTPPAGGACRQLLTIELRSRKAHPSTSLTCTLIPRTICS